MQRRISLIATVTLVLATLAGLSLSPGATEAAFPGTNGQIAFRTERIPLEALWVMEADAASEVCDGDPCSSVPLEMSNVSGVYDLLVHDGTKSLQFFYCKVRIDHDATALPDGGQAVTTASVCFVDVAGQGDPNSAILDDPNIDLSGPPPPPPYGNGAPFKGERASTVRRGAAVV